MGQAVAYRWMRFERVRSTNDVALDAARAGEVPGLVVWSGVQTGGKGRSARDWVSNEGGLWASVLLDVDPPEPMRGLIPIAVGCACCRALDDLGADVELRWPNDLMRGEAKLGGLLVETRSGEGALDTVVAGMGINVTNEPPVEGAANLADLHPTPTPADLLDAILERLPSMETAIEEGDADRICRVFMGNAWGMDREMRLDGEPVVPKDVAVDGALIVEDLEGEASVHRSGSLRPP
jgi:BirA family biotin operon repressor/biotin-[acetyl-CoA-carboxylase] ligase